MRKVTVIGAGNVGATCAYAIAQRDMAKNVVLLDVREGIAEGKALDMWQTSSMNNFNCRITGVTNNYMATKGSDVIVITAGIPRKPGMSRDDLVKINAKIVIEATQKSVKYSPEAIVMVVSNPLDVMTYAAFKAACKPSNKVFGMAGILDTGRYRAFLAEAMNVSPKDIHALLLGGHGDTMVPLPRYTSVNGIPVTQMLAQEDIDRIVKRTKSGGGELVNLMGTSAWYAPGTAVAQMVEAVLGDEQRIFPVCAYLTGEYGIKDLYIGVPVKLGKNGIEEIIEVELDPTERKLLLDSSESVRSVMDYIDKMNIFDEE